MPSNQPPDPKGPPSGPQQQEQQHQQQQAPQRQQMSGGPAIDPAAIAQFIKDVAAAGGVPILLSQPPAGPVDTTKLLNAKPPVTVAFPSCSEVLLGLLRTTGVDPLQKREDVEGYFDEYFKFTQHQTIPDPGRLKGELDDALARCLSSTGGHWPPHCCLCPPCLTLDGNRNASPQTPAALRRLFLGDVIFLFHWEWVFQLIGVILSDFATNGRLPISNGSLDGGVRDDMVALILEVMIRETKTGASSTVRDRDSTYRRVLGWTSELGRKLNVDAQANAGFSSLFHKLIHHALAFYEHRRLATAIRGTAAPQPPPSVATLTAIGDTIGVLRKRLEVFDYGRNHYNTLNGIMWVIAGMSIVREIRTTLGIPPAFDRPHEYMDAAYTVLVRKQAVTGTQPNRYSLSRDLAKHGRDVMLDIEVLDDADPTYQQPNGLLDRWLSQVEPKIESYRNAYRTLTGIDLGASTEPQIPHQV